MSVTPELETAEEENPSLACHLHVSEISGSQPHTHIYGYHSGELYVSTVYFFRENDVSRGKNLGPP